MPHFLLHDSDDLYDMDRQVCKRAKQVHALHANCIIALSSFQLKSYLLVFPNEVTCSTDFESTASSTQDEKVKMSFRKMVKTFQMGKATKTIAVDQNFNPVFWLLRIVDSEHRILKKAVDEDEDDDFARALQGMRL